VLAGPQAAHGGISGTQRLRAYGRLDVDLAARAAPDIAFAVPTARDFFSARIGCQTYQPIYRSTQAGLRESRDGSPSTPSQ
jgi:hypothetical protein